MQFIDAYKRLDNLCRTFSDFPRGLSSYIEAMEDCGQIRHQPTGWTADYQQLKHYRWARNRIVHDNDVYEDDLCTDSDIDWLEDFHRRILERSDPLALYYRSKQAAARQAKKYVTQRPQNTHQSQPSERIPQRNSSNGVSVAAAIILIALAAIVTIFFAYLRS